MTESEGPRPGRVGWIDLTVGDAEGVTGFYREVAGWNVEPVDMGSYNDFNMLPPGSLTPTAGICHARGRNADLPPQWLIYITVEGLDGRLERCRELGGEVLAGPRGTPETGRYAVIRDPAGAVAALFEPPPA